MFCGNEISNLEAKKKNDSADGTLKIKNDTRRFQ